MDPRPILYIGLGAVIVGAIVLYSKKSQASSAMIPVGTTGWTPLPSGGGKSSPIGTAAPKPSGPKPIRIEQVDPVTWNPLKNQWQMGINVTYADGTTNYVIETSALPQNSRETGAQWAQGISDDWGIPLSAIKVQG
jgi:hypothetical protein